jgi:hypothetical protein
LIRQRTAPLADECRRYPIHCSEQGMGKRTLRLTAELLVASEDGLKLAERPNSIINLQEIEEAGTGWMSRKAVPPIRLHPKESKQRFVRNAVRWLAFMGRLQPPSKPTTPYEDKIVEFADSWSAVQRLIGGVRRISQKIPPPHVQRSYDCIEIDDLSVTAERVMAVQMDAAPSRRRHLLD